VRESHLPDSVPDNLRRHDLDALRASAMLLGIAYHVALSFALAFPWMVQDVSQTKGFNLFQFCTHGFRMQLFFLISGFFTTMLWRRRGLKSLIWHRVRRILLPCLLGLITVVPAMKWASATAIESGTRKEHETAAPRPVKDTIWTAIKAGEVEQVKTYLADEAKINIWHPEYGTTPLTWASLVGRSEAVALLLETGAEVNARNRDGGRALHAAAFLGRAGIVDQLIAAGADVHAKSGTGETALNSAKADWGITQYIAGLLQIEIDRQGVERGRALIVARLSKLGVIETVAAAEETDRNAREPGPLRGLMLWLLYNPVFILIWFLWFLWWLVVCFAVYAWIAGRLGWKGPPKWFFLSPVTLLWVVPLTMIPQWFMGSSNGGFGPDISMGIIPMPHIFLYYAIFFGFGVLYYDCEDTAGRLGRSWRWTLPIGLFVVFPLGLEMSTGTFGFRGDLLPGNLHRSAAVMLQALYAWLMTFGCMGLFRSILTRENRTIRYLSDSSYWLYLAHLPLTIVAQVFIRDWPLPAFMKFTLLCVVITGSLLVIYQTLVRYTWLGTLLNGPRRRPERPPPVPISAEGEPS